MSNFHKLFLVKTNNMIKKKIGESFFVVYVIYGSLLCTDSKKTMSCFTPLTARFILFMQVLKGN